VHLYTVLYNTANTSLPVNAASSKGFKNVANYIFGNNTNKVGNNQKISMTAPVIMAPQSDKIDMTTPVSLKQDNGVWEVSFVMPSKYDIGTLPAPNTNNVTLVEVPSKTYAVIRFSGLSGEKKIAKKTQTLNSWIKEQALTPKSSPKIARYNPPWTPPFMRRNEIMVEVNKPKHQ